MWLVSAEVLWETWVSGLPRGLSHYPSTQQVQVYLCLHLLQPRPGLPQGGDCVSSACVVLGPEQGLTGPDQQTDSLDIGGGGVYLAPASQVHLKNRDLVQDQQLLGCLLRWHLAQDTGIPGLGGTALPLCRRPGSPTLPAARPGDTLCLLWKALSLL